VVLGDPGAVESEAVGSDDLVRHARVHGLVRVGLPILVGLRGEEDAELHVVLSH
jgi:hypothetical protein